MESVLFRWVKSSLFIVCEFYSDVVCYLAWGQEAVGRRSFGDTLAGVKHVLERAHRVGAQRLFGGLSSTRVEVSQRDFTFVLK